MAWPVISKGSSKSKLNMPDYDRARAGFDWVAAAALDGLPDGKGLNAAYEAADRHVAAGRGDQTALRCLTGNGVRELTYARLAEESARFAALLTKLGVQPGETVSVLLGRSLELYVATLGVLKARAVLCPLFTALGPEPVRARLALGAARVLVTTAEMYRRKLAGLRHMLPDLREVLIVDAAGAPPEGCRDLAAELAGIRAGGRVPATGRDDPALLHFTSGTTGAPKGALHGHGAIEGQAATARMVLDLRPGDVFWCTADPGWVTGTVYGILAPLAVGATCVVDPEPFDAGRWYTILGEQKVTVFYTTPTAIRMLMRFGAALARSFRVKGLRVAASVGEPLNAEAVLWGREALGVPFHDTWWQTETGAITIANFPSMDIKPGSMGRVVPGVEAAIVRRNADGIEMVSDPEEVGEIAIRRGPPSLFQCYLGAPARTEACFVDEWYLTGDLARRDTDGYFWFVGRKDDLIKSSGHLIGPFEIESVLMDHPAVAEAGVIGRPDPLVNEVVTAFITLNPGFDEGEALRRELLGFAREQLGSALAPKELVFVREMPKTNSGKIMRRVLRLRDLGVSDAETAAPLPG
jgi:acetyl-CoA synthetase